jgi:hypothetical protein
MKTKLVYAALAAALTVSMGLANAAFASDRNGPTWSIVVHFTYADGFEFEYPLATGIAATDVSAYLADCGASHGTRSVVRYYCYAIPE